MRIDDTTSATTASEIVTIRSTRGVSHEKFFVDSQARAPEAAPTAAAAHIEHIAAKFTPTSGHRPGLEVGNAGLPRYGRDLSAKPIPDPKTAP